MINKNTPDFYNSPDNPEPSTSQSPDANQLDIIAPEIARRLLKTPDLVVLGEREPEGAIDLVEAYESYLGVCDVYSPDEAKVMADELRDARNNPNRKVMIGVMTHPLVLDDSAAVPTSARDGIRRIFPTRDEMATGFIDDPDVFNTVHYADLYGPNGPWKAGESPNLAKNLELVTKYGGDHLHAIQLDLTWPEVDELKRFKDTHPDLEIILQVGRNAFKEAGNNPQAVVAMLRAYGDAIDYALLDTSMGKGVAMEPQGLLPILRTIQQELPDLGLAVAGGMGPDTLDALRPVADEFPGISIDAQGNLKRKDAPRDELGHFVATYPAELNRSTEYIRKSCEILDRY